ncbi:hypothetical protein HPP92_012509 [Vanilla planifolia]|uniref:Uncharacterized protein n=1 Tax=Vanilla planifolia TaxID=51239 RepID=A0A835QME1_VANPL|nr:hypothetical protein HPP92_012901 [Vanilla planifolia]KAG0477790.1 hypothetical protein HPP92_012509 [Vanilla planifolia]
MTSYVLLSSTVAAMGGLLVGHGIGIVSGLLPCSCLFRRLDDRVPTSFHRQEEGVTSTEPFLKKFFSKTTPLSHLSHPLPCLTLRRPPPPAVPPAPLHGLVPTLFSADHRHQHHCHLRAKRL